MGWKKEEVGKLTVSYEKTRDWGGGLSFQLFYWLWPCCHIKMIRRVTNVFPIKMFLTAMELCFLIIFLTAYFLIASFIMQL